MEKPKKIHGRVYLVGGPEITDPRDCCIYLVDGGSELALIDAGTGDSGDKILKNIEKLGLTPNLIKYVIATHGHIDHIGGLDFFKSRGAKVVCHKYELDAVKGGWPQLTAAWIYNVSFQPVDVDIILHGDDEQITAGDAIIHCPLTPGHTPGGISPYLTTEGKRVLFGQDIHGPFDSSWGSNMEEWYHSMQKLLALEADILCEGHFGIFSPAEKVKEYINYHIRRYFY